MFSDTVLCFVEKLTGKSVLKYRLFRVLRNSVLLSFNPIFAKDELHDFANDNVKLTFP
jgi:hypothetical protein